jgi:hypothetical protein
MTSPEMIQVYDYFILPSLAGNVEGSQETAKIFRTQHNFIIILGFPPSTDEEFLVV